jgi:ketosteroid isomerase-like protein
MAYEIHGRELLIQPIYSFMRPLEGDVVSNRESVQRYYECIDSGNLEGLLGLFAEGIHYRRCGRDIKGMAELRNFYENGRDIRGTHSIENLFQVDAKTFVVEGNFEGTRGDGTKIAFGFSDFHFFDDGGKIFERHTYTSLGQV